VSKPELQVALLKKLLKGEVRTRLRTNQTQAKQFSEELQAVLARYDARQLTSAEVVAALVELAKKATRGQPPPRGTRTLRRGGRLLRRASRKLR
jgi:hypothetical protein